MAKLNNSGWGVSNMIAFLIIFIIFILIVAFLVYDVDHEKDSDIQLVQEELFYYLNLLIEKSIFFSNIT